MAELARRPLEAILLDNVAGGTTGAAVVWPGGQLCLTAEFTGGSVDVQFLGPSGNWIDIVPLKAVSSQGLQVITGVPSGSIRAISSAGAANTTVWVILNVD